MASATEMNLYCHHGCWQHGVAVQLHPAQYLYVAFASAMHCLQQHHQLCMLVQHLLTHAMMRAFQLTRTLDCGWERPAFAKAACCETLQRNGKNVQTSCLSGASNSPQRCLLGILALALHQTLALLAQRLELMQVRCVAALHLRRRRPCFRVSRSPVKSGQTRRRYLHLQAAPWPSGLSAAPALLQLDFRRKMAQARQAEA
mmetsp:Transcript_122995/g.244781  ORF Transcript_122995/g.244781 Transcript_122995/m.244781 type:complete len:201 (+) Transcript_122995:697-1299(+)